MSKHQTIKAIRNEIERLNKEIDLRIIRGLPYKREALRHKALMVQLSRMSSGGFSWFGKSLSFVSMFLF
jgi:hypothetical protein